MQLVPPRGPHKGKGYRASTSRAVEQRGCFIASTDDGFLDAVNTLKRHMLRGEQHRFSFKRENGWFMCLKSKNLKNQIAWHAFG